MPFKHLLIGGGFLVITPPATVPPSLCKYFQSNPLAQPTGRHTSPTSARAAVRACASPGSISAMSFSAKILFGFTQSASFHSELLCRLSAWRPLRTIGSPFAWSGPTYARAIEPPA